jgi:alanyl-tRNA synthetase
LQAGVRRLEALTAKGAEEYVNQHLKTLDTLNETLKSPKNIQTAVESLQDENRSLRKQVEQFYILQTRIAKADLLSKAVQKDGQTVVKGIVEIGSADALRQLAQDLRKEVENLYAVIGTVVDGKPQLVVTLSDSLVAQGLDAAKIVRELAKHIQGGGGGQAFLATAGGKEVGGLAKAME